MGFLTNIFEVGIKVVLTPVALGVDILRGDLGVEGTGNLLNSVGDSLEDAVDNLGKGDII